MGTSTHPSGARMARGLVAGAPNAHHILSRVSAVRTCHRILRAPRASARRARADGLKQGLPRRKQARSSWQPTIVAVSAEESADSSEGSASSDRRGRDTGVEAGLGRVRVHGLREAQARRGSYPRRPCPGCGDRVAATGRTRPTRAGCRAADAATDPRDEGGDRGARMGRAEGARARLPRGGVLARERKLWLHEPWVGLTQADRDAFRAESTRPMRRGPSQTVAWRRLAEPPPRSDIRLTRGREAPIHQ